MIEMTGEPLIEGMLVGKEKNILTTSETHQVRSDISQQNLKNTLPWEKDPLDIY
jgi:amidase